MNTVHGATISASAQQDTHRPLDTSRHPSIRVVFSSPLHPPQTEDLHEQSHFIFPLSRTNAEQPSAFSPSSFFRATKLRKNPPHPLPIASTAQCFLPLLPKPKIFTNKATLSFPYLASTLLPEFVFSSAPHLTTPTWVSTGPPPVRFFDRPHYHSPLYYALHIFYLPYTSQLCYSRITPFTKA
jgi:hypothetical protein